MGVYGQHDKIKNECQLILANLNSKQHQPATLENGIQTRETLV